MGKVGTTPDFDALLQAAEINLPGPKCTIGRLIAKLPPEQQDKVNRALQADKNEVRTYRITAALQAMTGQKLDPQTVGRHRHRKCRCD